MGAKEHILRNGAGPQGPPIKSKCCHLGLQGLQCVRPQQQLVPLWLVTLLWEQDPGLLHCPWAAGTMVVPRMLTEQLVSRAGWCAAAWILHTGSCPQTHCPTALTLNNKII